MDVALVWNAGAGSAGEVSREDVVARIAAAGRDVAVLEASPERGPAACAREAMAAGARVVVAAGGDGTVSAVAAALVGSGVALGVLPTGTSNSFAAALGIPADVPGALDALLAEGRRVIDAARVTGAAPPREVVMVLHCMVGFHADTIENTPAAAKQRWGALAYVASAIRELGRLASFDVEFVTDAHAIRCRATAIAAANLAPIKTVLAQGPSHLVPDDGRVDVTIAAFDTVAEAIATGVHLLRTARADEPASRENVGSFSAARVAITADPPQRVLVDGEAFGETPITIETIPGALTVIAPPPDPAAESDPVEAPLFGLPDLEIDLA